MAPSEGKEPRNYITDSAIEGLRDLTRGLEHFQDSNIRIGLDEILTRRIEANDKEVWWEQDRAYGIVEDWVIRIDAEIPEATGPIYGVVRRDETGRSRSGLVCITVLGDYSYEQAIRSRRWLDTRPVTARPMSLDNKALAALEDMSIPVPVAGAPAQVADTGSDEIEEEDPVPGRKTLRLVLSHLYWTGICEVLAQFSPDWSGVRSPLELIRSEASDEAQRLLERSPYETFQAELGDSPAPVLLERSCEIGMEPQCDDWALELVARLIERRIRGLLGLVSPGKAGGER